jgi:hypothetical protein
MSAAPEVQRTHSHVVVVGMHRSGTSAVANAVARLGLALPDETDLITPGPFNQRGYWESRRFVTFNDRVLRRLGGTWSAPPMPARGWETCDDTEMADIRADAKQFCRREFDEHHMVLKDPRLCITLPLWRMVFERPPAAVLVLRDPLEVARSLEFRNGFPLSLGLAMWRRYVQQSAASVEGLPVFVIEYGDLLRHPREWIGRLVHFLGDAGFQLADDPLEDARSALEPDLRHHRTESAAEQDLNTNSLLTESRRFLHILTEHLGDRATWSGANIPPEPAWVGDVLGLVAAGEMVTFANAGAQRELKWIKRSRLFRVNRLVWRVTSSGPMLSTTTPTTDSSSDASRGRSISASPSSSEPLQRWADAARRVVRSGRAPAVSGQIPHEDNPPEPAILEDFRLFAVIKTWMDEDIIEATVRNAMVQGVERVYLVDNASRDATVENAVAAGAIVAEIYETEAFDGRLVQPLVNAVVARESLRSREEHVWWLLLDSDEFPEGPNGMTLRDYLASLDRRFRVVGSAFVNHVPDGKPEYVEGFHPIDFQPLCYTFEPANNAPCPLGHWKHPLQRFDRHGQFVLSNDGAHRAFASERLVEPATGIVTHHFQYRDEARTRAKLDLVCGPDSARVGLHESAGFSGFARRRRSLDAVYTQHWDSMDVLPNRRSGASLQPEPWPDRFAVRRWYSRDEARSARNAAADPEVGKRSD